jgi:hypothetical protein
MSDSARERRSPARATAGRKTVLGSVVRNGRRAWRIADGETIVTLSTKPSVAAAMDEALVLYSGTLRRLADR